MMFKSINPATGEPFAEHAALTDSGVEDRLARAAVK